MQKFRVSGPRLAARASRQHEAPAARLPRPSPPSAANDHTAAVLVRRLSKWPLFVATFLLTLVVSAAAWAQDQNDDESSESGAQPQRGRSQIELPETTIRGQMPRDATADAPVEPRPTTVPEPESPPPQDQPPANDDQSPRDDVSVVTPTGTETSIRNTGSSITVIDADQIRASGATSVLDVIRNLPGVDVLRNVPGLDAVQQGGIGGVSSVFLRGSNSNQTKVLLDGIPLNDPASAGRAFDFSTLDVENIERIEILRGPQSGRWGSDAIGGVINIITRRGRGPLTVRNRILAGSFGTWREALSASAGDDCFHFSFGGTFFSTDGVSAASRRLGHTERDGYDNGTLGGRFGYTPTCGVEVEYIFRYVNALAEVDDFDFITALPVDNLRRENSTIAFMNRVQLRTAILDESVENRAAFSLIDYRRRDSDPGPFVPERFVGLTRKFEDQLNILVVDDQTFSVGMDYAHEQAENSFDPQQQQNNTGVYLQHQCGLWDRWYTTFAWRFDEHSTAGWAETYRITSVFQLPETDTALRGTIGTGFRAPALAEKFSFFSAPDLAPENSKGWDYGIDQWLLEDTLLISATYFRNKYRNLIQFDLNTFLLDNVGRAKAHGVEIAGLCRLTECLDFTANYTHTDTEDLDTGLLLLRRPQDKLGLGLVRRFCDERGHIGIDAIFVGDRLDTRNRVLQEYWLVNLHGSWKLNDNVDFFSRCDNLLDAAYEEVAGFGVLGIGAYGGVRIGW